MRETYTDEEMVEILLTPDGKGRKVKAMMLICFRPDLLDMIDKFLEEHP